MDLSDATVATGGPSPLIFHQSLAQYRHVDCQLSAAARIMILWERVTCRIKPTTELAKARNAEEFEKCFNWLLDGNTRQLHNVMILDLDGHKLQGSKCA